MRRRAWLRAEPVLILTTADEAVRVHAPRDAGMAQLVADTLGPP